VFSYQCSVINFILSGGVESFSFVKEFWNTSLCFAKIILECCLAVEKAELVLMLRNEDLITSATLKPNLTGF